MATDAGCEKVCLIASGSCPSDKVNTMVNPHFVNAVANTFLSQLMNRWGDVRSTLSAQTETLVNLTRKLEDHQASLSNLGRRVADVQHKLHRVCTTSSVAAKNIAELSATVEHVNTGLSTLASDSRIVHQAVEDTAKLKRKLDDFMASVQYEDGQIVYERSRKKKSRK